MEDEQRAGYILHILHNWKLFLYVINKYRFEKSRHDWPVRYSKGMIKSCVLYSCVRSIQYHSWRRRTCSETYQKAILQCAHPGEIILAKMTHCWHLEDDKIQTHSAGKHRFCIPGCINVYIRLSTNDSLSYTKRHVNLPSLTPWLWSILWQCSIDISPVKSCVRFPTTIYMLMQIIREFLSNW